MRLILLFRMVFVPGLVALLAGGCDKPETTVVLDNNYPSSTSNPFIVNQAFWQAISFTAPVPPGASSEPQDTIPASANTAYVLVAPGWDPKADGGASTPTSLIVLQSRSGFEVHIDHQLRIPVDDADFIGNCAAGSVLTRDEADFITQRVFADVFAGLHYDPTTCSTTGAP